MGVVGWVGIVGAVGAVSACVQATKSKLITSRKTVTMIHLVFVIYFFPSFLGNGLVHLPIDLDANILEEGVITLEAKFKKGENIQIISAIEQSERIVNLVGETGIIWQLSGKYPIEIEGQKTSLIYTYDVKLDKNGDIVVGIPERFLEVC
jgi:hypothetical protein